MTLTRFVGLLSFRAGVVALAAITVLGARPAAGQAPPAGKASGELTIDGKVMKVNHAYAWTEPNTFDEAKTDTVVLLTTTPVPAEMFSGVEGLLAVARRIDGFALFGIDASGTVTREVAGHPALGGQWLQISGGATRAAFTKKVLSADRIEGSFRTKAGETVMEHRYAVKVDLAAPVVAAPRPEPLPDAKTGTLLPGGGGEPGKAYMALYRAIAKKDAAAVLNLLVKRGRTPSDEAQLKDGIEMMAMMQPSGAKVVKGFVSGDRAALYVEGVEEKVKQYGTIEVVREEGTWRVGKQKWSDKPPGR